MIIVRDIFSLKFGKAKAVKELWKEGAGIIKKYGDAPHRAMFDLVGNAYTFVLESTHENLSSYESSLKSTLGAEEWSAWYQKFIPLVDSSKREIFTIVE